MNEISRQELQRRIEREGANNEDMQKGFALVNVLDKEEFSKEHIPNSINIPHGREVEFERRFDRTKEIVVYCASAQCPASSEAAEELRKRGFANVYAYEGGMADWRSAGNRIEGSAA